MAQLYFFSLFSFYFWLWLNRFELWLGAPPKHKQSRPWQILKNTFFQNSCFLFKPLLKNCKKQVHKGYPLAGPCICNYKLKWTFAIKNNLFGSLVLFWFSFFLLLLIVVEWFWLVIGCSFKGQTKQTFTDIRLRKIKLS